LTSNYEGYGRTIIEAQACGLPVVMTDVGVAGEFILEGENGLIVPVGDDVALADAIEKVYTKQVHLKARMSGTKTKEVYLREYKELWERCVS